MLVYDASHVTFFVFIHLHLASHLGTLDEPRGEPKDMMLEPNPKIVFGGPILKMEGPLEYISQQEMLTKQASSNKH